MSELSKAAESLLGKASEAVDRLIDEHTQVNVGQPPSPMLASLVIQLGHATATLALVQATEAQTATLAKQWGRSRP